MKLNISLSPSQISRLLLGITISLIGASVLGQLLHFWFPLSHLIDSISREFNLDLERNIPTLYTSGILLFSSLLLAIIAYGKRLDSHRYTWKWQLLSYIFMYLAADEEIQIHERLVNALRSAFDIKSGIFYFAWVIPGIILVSFLGMAYWKFFIQLPFKSRRLFFLAAVLYVGGALGAELIGGYISSRYGETNLIYSIETTLEESLEMMGITLFIYALLSYLNTEWKEAIVQVQLTKNLPNYPLSRKELSATDEEENQDLLTPHTYQKKLGDSSSF